MVWKFSSRTLLATSHLKLTLIYGLNLDLDIVGRLICQLSRLSQDTHVPSYLMLVEQANLDLRDFHNSWDFFFALTYFVLHKKFYFEGYFCNWNNSRDFLFLGSKSLKSRIACTRIKRSRIRKIQGHFTAKAKIMSYPKWRT